MLLLSPFVTMLKTMSSSIAQQVAFCHFLFNIIVVFMFMFLLTPFSNAIRRLLPGEHAVIAMWPEYLDTKHLGSPDRALVCVRNELKRQIALAQRMLLESLELFVSYRSNKRQNVMYMELVMDNLQAEITTYLWGISCGALSQPLTKKLFAFSSFAYDIERMGDRSVNLGELAEQKYKRRAHFTPAANEELRDIGTLVLDNLADAGRLIEKKDIALVRVIIERERRIDVKIKKATGDHLERFYKKLCLAEAGPIYVDVLVNLEHISNHCLVIAQLTNELEEEETA
jgi:phosphate:Na+ symporter